MQLNNYLKPTLEPTTLGTAQVLPANIRLGLKGLTGTNALTYHEISKLTTVKSFITLTPGPAIDCKNISSQKRFLYQNWIIENSPGNTERYALPPLSQTGKCPAIKTRMC
jgi:hypothetical protein